MINISGPSRLTLSPDTLACVLDALAEYGPFKRVNPAFTEILNQLKEANEHTPGRPEPVAVSNNNVSSDVGPRPDIGVGSNGTGNEVGHSD